MSQKPPLSLLWPHPLTVTVIGNVTHGTLTFNGNDFTYLPNPDYAGPDSFTSQVSDGELDSNVTTVSITVNPVNDAPVATFTDAQSAEEGGAVSGSFEGYLLQMRPF